MSKRQEPWGNEKHMRPYIAARRELCIHMRDVRGDTWDMIAQVLNYSSAQHACIDYGRGKKRLQDAETQLNNNEARPHNKPRPRMTPERKGTVP